MPNPPTAVACGIWKLPSELDCSFSTTMQSGSSTRISTARLKKQSEQYERFYSQHCIMAPRRISSPICLRISQITHGLAGLHYLLPPAGSHPFTSQPVASIKCPQLYPPASQSARPQLLNKTPDAFVISPHLLPPELLSSAPPPHPRSRDRHGPSPHYCLFWSVLCGSG